MPSLTNTNIGQYQVGATAEICKAYTTHVDDKGRVAIRFGRTGEYVGHLVPDDNGHFGNRVWRLGFDPDGTATSKRKFPTIKSAIVGIDRIRQRRPFNQV